MIIAEIGQNYCGDMGLAKKLINLAKENGADLAKFQLFDSKKLEVKTTCELTFAQALDLFQYGERAGIEVFFSVFDVERVGWCEDIGVKRYKVAYSQRHNQQLIKAILATKKHSIISSDSYDDCLENGWVLFCNPKYPDKIDDFTNYLYDGLYFDGLSEHTIGIDLAKIAFARLSNIVLEKHFAIDHCTGVDAPWSMTPDELHELADYQNFVRNALC